MKYIVWVSQGYSLPLKAEIRCAESADRLLDSARRLGYNVVRVEKL